MDSETLPGSPGFFCSATLPTASTSLIFVLSLMRRFWDAHFDVHIKSTHVTFMLASTVVATLVSLFLYRHVERTLSRVLEALLKRPKRSLGKAPLSPPTREPDPVPHHLPA